MSSAWRSPGRTARSRTPNAARSRAAGRRASSSRSQTRSPAVRQRSSATSSPNACSACPEPEPRPRMDFTLTEDQQLLRETARKLLDKECPLALVRAHIDDPEAYLPLWEHLR